MYKLKQYVCQDFSCTRKAIVTGKVGKLLCGKCWIEAEKFEDQVAYIS